MKTYTLPCLESIDWAKAECQSIEECRWSPNAAPEATVQGIYLKGEALVFRIVSHAKPARKVNTQPDSSVWEDSCLECFLSFDGKNYMNIECNANGTFLCCFGPDRNERKFVRSLGIAMPEATAKEEESCWEIMASIPLDCIESLWGCRPDSGDFFSANFYSCGDKTPLPHYAAWNEVETESPDFHRPEYFGKIMIG